MKTFITDIKEKTEERVQAKHGQQTKVDYERREEEGEQEQERRPRPKTRADKMAELYRDQPGGEKQKPSP